MISATVSLETAETRYNLLTLVRAIHTDLPDGFKHVVIQSDPENAAAVVWIGDSGVTSTERIGFQLGAGEGHVWSPSDKPTGLKNIFAVSDTNAAVLNIALTR